MIKRLTLVSFSILLGIYTCSGALLKIGQNDDLQLIIERAADGDTLSISTGRFIAKAVEFIESTCGNCQTHLSRVNATRGFAIENKKLTICGSGADSTILVTQAGYGLLLHHSRGSNLENLGITGGIRDSSGDATDGGIVIKYSNATIRNCRVFNNTNRRDSVIVGIGGIMIRENSMAWIENCRITNNTWDGIALYRGANAVISDCVIDSGRGAGIGVTWDATANCVRNRISNYWKGLGSFGTSTVVARNNLILDNLGWGLIASGESSMIAENNTVVHNGNCGIAIWNAGARGRMVNNISALNGWRKQWVCPCVGFWNQEADTINWVVKDNLVWKNSAAQVEGMDSTRFMIFDPAFENAEQKQYQLKKTISGEGGGG